VDPNGYLYVTGAFLDTATFGIHPITSVGSWDVFVASLDTSGIWQWAESAGGTDSDSGSGICVDSSGNSYVTGVFWDTATFGTHSVTSYGWTDVFVAKVDPTGTSWEWAARGGGNYTDYVFGICGDSSGNIYITGHFNRIADFGIHNIGSNGGMDVFVAKLEDQGAIPDLIIHDISTGTVVPIGDNIYEPPNWPAVTQIGRWIFSWGNFLKLYIGKIELQNDGTDPLTGHTISATYLPGSPWSFRKLFYRNTGGTWSNINIPAAGSSTTNGITVAPSVSTILYIVVLTFGSGIQIGVDVTSAPCLDSVVFAP
jgi:hypothetical protein